MAAITRLPALPLVVNDPYFSIWCAADRLTDATTTHWSGAEKPLLGTITVDGQALRFLGLGDAPAMETVSLSVTPTMTCAVYEGAGVRLSVRFITPTLPDDLETLSLPMTMLDFQLDSLDGAAHEAEVVFSASDRLCYDGDVRPDMLADGYRRERLNYVYTGQRRQKLLCHSGDRITIDWGYLFLASEAEVGAAGDALHMRWQAQASPGVSRRMHAFLGYDDVASILYFGTPCKAWYARDGVTLPQAMAEINRWYDAMVAACATWDRRILKDAEQMGQDYTLIVCAAWRQTFAAHKLIATPDGEMALLSKENDSNGCIGTVDISYPSAPIFLKYCPQLVDALARPVLAFASMPVWDENFAPHDVGRYPIVGGQVYGVNAPEGTGARGNIYPPYYLYPPEQNLYKLRDQMPVEECGNMLIMLAAALEKTGDDTMVHRYQALLERWVQYLVSYGDDPGDQLCTDDFAGHLAHNVNLSAKAIVGIACYARIMTALGRDGSGWMQKAREMAKDWLARAQREQGTALTFDGGGWSQKYNLVWDLVLDLQLLPRTFYRAEVDSYLPRMQAYGLPLDSRATYTKSDWIVWSASLAQDLPSFRKLIAPLARYLRETPTRVPFGDWYDAVTGEYVHFIARSVQGGIFMPMLRKDWQQG